MPLAERLAEYVRAWTEPLLCRDQNRHYVWMPLDTEGVIAPGTDATRIESPGEPATTPSPPTPRSTHAMPKAKPKTSPSGQDSNGQTRAQESAAARDTPLAEALAVKQALHEALAKTEVLFGRGEDRKKLDALARRMLDAFRSSKVANASGR